MATLGEMTVKIELSPEMKEELAALHAKLDLVLDKLGEAAQPVEFKLLGRELTAIGRLDDYRAL